MVIVAVLACVLVGVVWQAIGVQGSGFAGWKGNPSASAVLRFVVGGVLVGLLVGNLLPRRRWQVVVPMVVVAFAPGIVLERLLILLLAGWWWRWLLPPLQTWLGVALAAGLALGLVGLMPPGSSWARRTVISAGAIVAVTGAALSYHMAGAAWQRDFDRAVMAPVGELLSNDVLVRGGPLRTHSLIWRAGDEVEAMGVMEGTDVRATVMMFTGRSRGSFEGGLVSLLVGLPTQRSLTPADMAEPEARKATLEGAGMRPELAVLFVPVQSDRDRPRYRAVQKGFAWEVEGPPATVALSGVGLSTRAVWTAQGLEPVGDN
jgi:hypothetical protein